MGSEGGPAQVMPQRQECEEEIGNGTRPDQDKDAMTDVSISDDEYETAVANQELAFNDAKPTKKMTDKAAKETRDKRTKKKQEKSKHQTLGGIAEK